MALSGTHTNWVYGSYEADRNDQIKISENHPLHDGDLTKLNAHIDGKNRLALAYGYDLLANINTLINDLSPFVTSLKAGMSATQALGKVKSLVLNPGSKTKAQIRDEINTYITLGTEAKATLLLNKTISNFETALDNKLGGNTLPLSRERAAVISQIYRLGTGGAPSLMKAIINDNRAEAWFQIRFNSNADNLAGNYIRVVAESNMFNLYDAGGVTEASAKEVIRMYLRNKPKIIEEEAKYPSAYDNSDSITNQISPARNYLISKYGEGVNIDGEVIVGMGGSATYDYLESNYSDSNLKGTTKNDLIFGERGDDIIKSTGGSDVVYGGQGNDQLIGGDGLDDLFGGAGNDTLIGTDGYGGDDGVADYLNGGEGYDTYIAGNNDIIRDDDGSGIIIFEGKVLHGVDVTQDSTIYPSNQDNNVYYSKIDKGTYTRNGNSGFTFVSDSGDKLTVYTPLDYTLKIIPKPGGGTMKQKTYRGVGVVLENFSSPLVLDLNHDGVTSLDLYATPAYFDMESDGIREKTGWIQSTDALLAFDKNRDGIINDGSELFGNYTTLANGTKASNGFEALEQYDNNHDGMIDKNDSVYNALSAWIDTNQDGVTDTGELHSLSELGVTSINLNATTTTAYEDQNAISHTSSFTQQTTDAEGNTITETNAVNDVWFRKDTTNTLSTATISDDIASLPQINGSGRVLDLHGAMQERTALKTAVETYLTSTATYADQAQAIKNILALWSNTDNINTTQARGEQWILNHNYGNAQPVYRYRIYAYARDVAILEQFAGTTFSMTTSDGKTTNDVIDSQMAQEMSNRLNDLIDTTMIKLLGQKLMGESFYDTTGRADYEAMFTAITSIMESGTQNDQETSATLIAAIIHRDGFESLNHFNQSLLSDSDFKTLLHNNGVTYTINPDGTFKGSYQDTVEGGSGDDILTATNSGIVYGGDGNDIIYGQNAADEHNNATGHEELHGGDGNDTIIGGTGDDILYGDAGDDTLYANTTSSGDGSYGHDFLIGGEGNDTLVGTARNSTYVYNYGDGFDTIIDGGNVGVTSDVLELRNIRFEDIIVGSNGNDMVIRIKDIVDPESDSGSITIKNGMNIGKIEKFVFDDQTVDFSKLQLLMQGLLKDDIYLFNRGDGSKSIIDYASLNGDTLQFAEGITADDIMVKGSLTNNNLIVALKEEGKTFSTLSDKLTITNWFNTDNRIEIFSFSDGTIWDANAILAHQGTDEADTARVLDTNADMMLDLGAGNDTIVTGIGNDTLTGSTGDDTLTGGGGNDVYVFNKGDGKDTISDNSGRDALSFGDGVLPNDLIVKVVAGSNDLIVAIKEDGVAFDELSDKIIIKNWFTTTNNIEQFRFNDGTTWNVNDIVSTQVTENADSIHAIDTNTAVNIHLLGGDDVISASNIDDIVYGDSGNDTIYSLAGNDRLVGGTDNDILQGGGGNDTYVFNRGDGRDSIADVENYQPYYWLTNTQLRNGGNDTLRFGVGITADDIIIKASANSNDLIVAIKEDGKTFAELSDKITLKNWFDSNYRIETIEFADGTIWDASDVINTQGTDEFDTVHLLDTTTDVTLNLKGGDDTVVTGSGNDTIEGGMGNDLLKGGEGNDTYILNRGDGRDTIIDVSGSDALSFGNGITENDIVVMADPLSDDLIVAIKEAGKSFDELSDKIVLKDWYADNNRIESFVFEDGTILDTFDITELQPRDDENNYLRYLEHDNTIDALRGDDIIHGGAGDDTYLFNRGDGIDHITDIAGIDTLAFGSEITVEDIEVHADNNYLIIGLKEDGKPFDELSDKIYFKQIGLNDYGIENLEFVDDMIIDPRSLISTYEGTDGNDRIDLTYLRSINPTVSIDDSLIINAKAGNDIVTVGDGDNQIDMGTGRSKTLIAGDGNNTIDSTQADITITLGEGDNTLNAADSYTNITAGSGNNTIHTMISSYTGLYAYLGNGNNTIIEADTDSFYGGEGSVYVDAGDGDNTIQLGENLSKDLTNDYLYRYTNITVGDGNNQISVKNGDGTLEIETGIGDNVIEFSSDIDSVLINYEQGEKSRFIGNPEGNNTIIQLADTDVEYSYYDYYGGTEELINVSNPNNVIIGLNDGNNNITLTDVAQDYTLDLVNGTNTIIIGKEGSDNNYAMQSLLSLGNGNNEISVLSGDGELDIYTAGGDNSMLLSADLDNVSIQLGDGDNIITQMVGVDTDGDNANTDGDIKIAAAYVYYGVEEYYGGEGDYYYGNETIYNDTISLLLGDGDNDITISRTDTLYGSFGEGDNSLRLGDVKRSYLEFNTGENRIEINSTGSSYADVAGSEKSTIVMGSGSTLLTARNNEETIISTGKGADDVYTYESNDFYIVNIGDGSDAILDMYGTDKIIFGEGITKENLKVRVEFYSDLMNHTENNLLMQQFQYDANADGFSFNSLMNANLVIQYSDDPSDVLILVNWYDSNSRIESFVFNDGSILSDHQIVSLIGTDEDDTVLGTEGDNTLSGGNGDDTVSGGEGNDIYRYSRGDAHDLFSEDGGFDTITFGEGITKDDLILQKVDNNLLISLKEAGNTQNDLADTITVSDWFNERGRIERFRFADGSTMELNEILSRVDADGVIYYGTPDVDAMEGTDIGDIIMARESDDIVNGYAGDDLLFGEAGNDTLDGGEGNDLLYGGEGNDTYVIDRNMGNDIVFDQNGTDTLRFAEGITSEDIGVWYDNNDLKIWVEGSEITLTDWYSTEHRIETLTFANGEILNVNDMINLQYEEVKGVSEGSTFDVDDGDTIYYAQEGNDTYRIGTYAGANSVIDAGGVDRIEFAEGISVDMLNLSYEGNDLIIELEGTSVRLSGWYTAKNRIESFAFTDGTILVAEEVIALMSTDGDDSIRSLEEGNYTNAGDGDDIYDVVNLSGMNTIEDVSGKDTIRMGAGISPDSLRITWIQGSDDILIQDKERMINGGLLIKNWYSPENRIETILFNDGSSWSSEDILDAMGSDEDDVYNGFKDQANLLHANDGSDVVSTFGFDDILYGGAGNDSLDAGDGDDTLIGEEGDDLLFGGAGDDTYLFNRGFGKDMIFEDAFGGADSAGDDHIVLGAGIAYDDVIVRSFENDNNLYIALKEDGKQFDELSDVITIKDWFLSANRIESISFGDGDVMSLIDVMHAKAAEEGEAISALGEGGMLIGTNDEDTLIGNKGDDFILGLDGDDDLIGAEGNDTLIGGQGDDFLEGSEGNDTYFFGRGDAHDTIYDNATAVQEQYGYVTDSDGVARWSKIEHEYSIDGGTDTVYFGEGITADDLIVKNEGFDLLITLKDSIDDVLRIQDYYKPFNTIEFFGFSDGTILSGSEFEALLFTPEDDDVTFVDDQDRILNGNEGDDTIHAGSGNDIIDGAGGDDTLNGGFGDDVYLFGRGSGHDTITDNGIGQWWQTRSGNDTVFFKEGISRDDLWVKEEGNDLLIAIKEEGKSFEELSDTLRIIGAFDDNNPFESVVFANGTNVSITALVNHAPEAQSEMSHTLQDVRVFSGEVGATDIDGDVLSYTVSTEASHGTLSVNESGEWSYSATDGYMGTDSAVIVIDDGNGGVIEQTLNFDVRVSAPTLSDSTSNLLEDTHSTGTLNVVNPIGGTLVYEVLNTSSKGVFAINEAGEWNYTPNADLNGSDSVTIKATNAYGLSTTATLNLAIEAVNDAPILTETPSAVTLYAGATSTGSIKASDVDGDTLSYSVTSTPEHGTLSINEKGEWNYSAERYYAGESSATISIDDGHGGSVLTTLNFTSLMTPDWHYTYSGQSMNINDNNGVDVLLMSDISMTNLTFLQEGNNLRIDVKDKNDVIITDYFTSTSKGVESLQTSEGVINLSKEKIGSSGSFFGIQWGSKSTDLISGKSSADTIYAGEGNDVIFGNAGNDALSGSKGNDLLIGGEGHDSLSGGNNDDTLYGDNGNDTLSGEAGNDKLFGGEGNDTLSGGEGNDLLNGGEGTNYLSGNTGNDTYLFTKGSNNTTINENVFGFTLFGRWIGQNGGNDTVKFGEGITKEDISFLMRGNDLLIQYGDNEFITINNQKSQANQIERLQLDDGSYLNNTDIDQIVQQINAYSKDHGFHIKDNSQIQNNQALMNIVAGAWHQ